MAPRRTQANFKAMDETLSLASQYMVETHQTLPSASRPIYSAGDIGSRPRSPPDDTARPTIPPADDMVFPIGDLFSQVQVFHAERARSPGQTKPPAPRKAAEPKKAPLVKKALALAKPRASSSAPSKPTRKSKPKATPLRKKVLTSALSLASKEKRKPGSVAARIVSASDTVSSPLQSCLAALAVLLEWQLTTQSLTPVLRRAQRSRLIFPLNISNVVVCDPSPSQKNRPS